MTSTVRLERAIWAGIAVLVILYVVLFLAGVRFFVFKTAVLPVLLAYGVLVRQRLEFVTDWLPLLSMTLLFDAVRGAIWILVDRGYQAYYVGYVIDLERLMFGTPAAPIPFQAYRTPALDAVAVLLHSTHFAYFLIFGLVLWHARRGHFGFFRRALGLLMLFGLIGYAVIPTAPPWIAAQPRFGALDPVEHVVAAMYTAHLPQLYSAFDTNPMAAMPSLHAAFPFLIAVVAWRGFGPRVGAVLSVYALLVMLAVIYLGEHYAVDVVAGVAVAAAAALLARGLNPVPMSFRATLLASAGGIAVAVVLVQLSRAIPARLF
jgi:membrane-associated phospholipid phosphatase